MIATEATRTLILAGTDLPALVDSQDYPRVHGFSWSLSGNGSVQAHIKGTRRREYLHRFILGLHPGDPLVDHINRDPLDNRRANLHLASKRINALNTGLRCDNKSGHRGVSRFGGKWRAYYTTMGKQKHLGLFARIEDAIQAAESARRAAA